MDVTTEQLADEIADAVLSLTGDDPAALDAALARLGKSRVLGENAHPQRRRLLSTTDAWGDWPATMISSPEVPEIDPRVREIFDEVLHDHPQPPARPKGNGNA